MCTEKKISMRYFFYEPIKFQMMPHHDHLSIDAVICIICVCACAFLSAMRMARARFARCELVPWETRSYPHSFSAKHLLDPIRLTCNSRIGWVFLHWMSADNQKSSTERVCIGQIFYGRFSPLVPMLYWAGTRSFHSMLFQFSLFLVAIAEILYLCDVLPDAVVYIIRECNDFWIKKHNFNLPPLCYFPVAISVDDI